MMVILVSRHGDGQKGSFQQETNSFAVKTERKLSEGYS